MTNRNALWAATALAGALLSATAVYAQETSGGMRGQVTDESGAPVAGATVTITHQPTGSSVTTLTDADGLYTVRNLRVGGPYSVQFSGKGFEPTTQTVATVGIGDPTPADAILFSASNTVSEVVVVASRGAVQTGPRLRVTQRQIDSSTSLNRDLKDYARRSPFVILDPTNNNALNIGGQNTRTNTITIDGVKQTDNFGLQANGYPTQNAPISISAVQSLNIEVAPYDVQYGAFQGGTVNVVTKSGGNEFHGELFSERYDNDWRGHHYEYNRSLDGTKVRAPVLARFNNKTWGASLSGPIWKDHLFFFLNYEKNESNQPVTTGPKGSGSTNEVPGVTQADVDQVRGIIKSVYGYDPLDWKSSSLPVEDEKKFVKLDWNIVDGHRASFSWQKTVGAALNSTGSSTSVSTPSLGLLSKWYNLTTDLEVYKGQLFDQWTDNFSTEINYSHKKVINESEPLAGTDFAEFRVYLNSTVFNANGTPVCTTVSPCPSIFLGPDISRQANQLSNESDLWKFKAQYRLGAHTLTGGYERENLDIFNVFVQRATGQYVFNGLTNLQNKNAFSLQYSNAADNIKEHGAAQFSFVTNTLYLQDEWQVTPTLTVRGGLRYDWYQSDDRPRENPAFQAAYGFKNTGNLDGISLLQPRLGFNWQPTKRLSIYGGVGLFQGGTPNVWISNQYTNTGNLLGFVSCTTANQAANCPNSLSNVNGFQVAAGAQTANTTSANLGTGNTNAIAPGFDTASVWKASIGFAYDFDLSQFRLGDHWRWRMDYLHTETNKAITWVDVYEEAFRSTPAPDGRPTFGTTAAKPLFGSTARQNRTDVVLTNTGQGYVNQLTFGVSKDFDSGWLNGVSIDLAQSFMDARDNTGQTSSVATSSYRQIAISDPNKPPLSNSSWEIAYATKFGVSYERAFIKDFTTRISLYGQRRAGLPFSYTFDDVSATAARNGMFGENSLYTGTDRQLLYVPKLDANGAVTAASDPIVKFAPGFDFAGFNKFLQRAGLLQYAGQISPRNAFRSRDVTTVDLHFAQEVPAFFPQGAHGEFYLDVINFGNLLNNSWGVLQQQPFPYFNAAVVARNCQPGMGFTCTAGPGNYYQYDSFTTRSQSTTDAASVWQLKLGVRYKF